MINPEGNRSPKCSGMADHQGPERGKPRNAHSTPTTRPNLPKETTMNSLACNECGQPMTWKGSGTVWEGNEQIDTVRFECSAAPCPTMATVEFRTWAPAPKRRLL